jgi:hypothetical protein
MRFFALLYMLAAGMPMIQVPPAPTLSSEAVGEAITLGLNGSKFTPVGCGASGGHGAGFQIEAMGPMNRIQAAALEARHKYLGFTPADVSDGMRASTLSVSAMPRQEIAMPGATHIVLKTRPRPGQVPIVLQPLSYQIHPTGWGNRKSAGIFATFDLASFKAILHEEIEVVTVTSGGEARCTLSEGMRRRIE